MRGMAPGDGGGDVEDVGEQEGQGGGDDGAEADEEALHGEAAGALASGEHVGDEGAEGFHADVDRGVENPQQAGGHPERGGIGHEQEREGAENGADEEVRPAAAERAPGAVAHVADDGLDDEAGERRGEPEHGNLVRARAEVLVDGTHVGHLQTPAELDAEEAEAHVPDLPEAQGGLVHDGPAKPLVVRITLPAFRGAGRFPL